MDLHALARAALGLATMLAAACQGSDGVAPTEGTRARPAIEDVERDQYRLAREVDEARRTGPSAATGALERLRQDWLHARVHWEVGWAPAFCRDRGPCMALPFDHQRLRTTMPQGWLPELDLDATARAALERCCAAVGGQCVFEVHGTVSRFELDRDRPTSLALGEVEVGVCRSARPGESWVRRAPRVARSRPVAGEERAR